MGASGFETSLLNPSFCILKGPHTAPRAVRDDGQSLTIVRPLDDCGKLLLTTTVWSGEAVSLRSQRGRCPSLTFSVSLGLICLCGAMPAMANGVSVTNSQSSEAFLPAPAGLAACASDDPVASVEKRLAPRLGAKFVGCFKSEEMARLRGNGGKHPVPVEYAIAVRMLGGPFSPANLDMRLSRVREQWKNFKPLSKEHGEYVERLNSMIQSVDSGSHAAPVASIKPVLISIDRLNPQAYVVLSVRHYVVAGNTGTMISTKADGTAIVLQGTRLMQLEILRKLSDPSDVDAVRQQIVAWTQEIAAHTGDKPRSH